MGKKYIVELDRKGCIGAATCAAVAPEFWQMQDDGKVDLLGAEKLEKNTKQKLEIDEKDFEKLKLSAEVCPVVVIKIYDKETGKEVV
jgi:ferredoxin